MVRDILDVLKIWNWEWLYLDFVLFFGWIICVYMGGVLDWCLVVFIMGGVGVGKLIFYKII